MALVAIEPVASKTTRQQLLAAQHIGNSSAWEVATDSGKVRMVPYPDITHETYRLYQRTKQESECAQCGSLAKK